jgi:hypothetical protein
MSIKHDNIVPSVWPESDDTTGFPVARIGAQVGDITSGVGGARVLGAISTALTAVTGTNLAARPFEVSRLLVNQQYPKITLPPPPALQAPGNANSTDYSCGIEGTARAKAQDPYVELTVEPPAVKVAVLNLYASNSALPLGYDPQAPVTELLVNTDFYVNLRIRPSVGLAGYDPTVFGLISTIGGTVYGGTSGEWAAGDGASNWLGGVYRIPGSYLGATGTATLTFSAGQTTVNPVFTSASTTVNVIPAVVAVTAAVEQTGWYSGIVTGNIDIVYQGQTLQLVVNGPPSTAYTYTLPWASGSSTTDANGQDTVAGTALQAGIFEFTVTFASITPFTKAFQVLNGATDFGGDAGGFSADADASNDASNSSDDGAAEGGNAAGDAAAAAASADGPGSGADGGGGDGGGGAGGGDGSGW